jgi:protein SCO1/2/putative membrane protein
VQTPEWVASLPAVNATLNSLSTVLLVVGYVLIRRGKCLAHKRVMLCAFGVSVAFLCCYLVYHGYAGSKPFTGTGPVRSVYFAILISHVILAAAVPFLAAITIYRGLRQQWERHRRIARVTFPIWLYVSVTGVIIYFMLYHWFRSA